MHEAYLDLDYKSMYRGHKCTIDTDSECWHDYSDFVNYSSLSEFLEIYRNIGFDERSWDSIEESFEIQTLLNKCKECPHSKNYRDCIKTTERYCLPNKKEMYVSCPLEKDFATGIKLKLDYKWRKQTVCNHCNEIVERPYFSENTPAELSFFDVRLKNTPTQLLVLRKEEICPHCKGRLAVTEIPRVQIALKHQMTIRLTHAIVHHSTKKGITGYCNRHIAQGYGISDSLLKKFLSERSAEFRDKGERSYLKIQKEMQAQTKLFYQCRGPSYSMLLCFSELVAKKDAPELHLCAAFDKNEIDWLTAWAHGDFSPTIPSTMTDTHLDFLADHCADIIFPDIDHMLAFRMVHLAIAYGKFLKSGRYAMESWEITASLVRCLHGLSSGEMSFNEFVQHIETIEGWSYYTRKQRIYRATRRVHAILDRYLGYRAFALLREVVCVSAASSPAEEDIRHAERIVQLIETSLQLSARWQVDADEDPDECYGTNSALTILRLLYINPAAITYNSNKQDYTETLFYGVPVSEVEAMLKSGLLDDRGRCITYNSGMHTQ